MIADIFREMAGECIMAGLVIAMVLAARAFPVEPDKRFEDLDKE